MGNIDSRSKFEGGYLYVKTDRPYYYPGNVVFGKVYIRAEYPFHPQELILRVKGKEKSSYVQEMGEERTKTSHKRVIYEFKGVCFTFQGPLDAGDYTIPFEFTLPEGIPSSIFFKDGDHSNRPKAKVKHTIKALLTTVDRFNMKYKQYINIHEPPVQFHEHAEGKVEQEIKSWCCCSKGPTSMGVTFNKNIFFQNEHAQARVEIDNSQCSATIKEVEFQVTQTLQIQSEPGEGFFTNRYTYKKDILENKDFNPIPALCPEVVKKDMSLNLDLIRFAILEKKGGEDRPPEEAFLLERMAPACHSKHIQNDYVLNVNLKYDACTCCGALPSISVPLSVIPLTHQASYGFVEPPEYAPIELGHFKFDLQSFQY